MTFFISPPFGEYISTSYTTSIRGSFTLYPRYGLFLRVIQTLRYSFKYRGWVNDIGLRNKGIDYALQTYKNGEVISIAILEKSDISEFRKKIPSYVDLEINISYPNIEGKSEDIGRELSSFLNEKRKWCILKVSPITPLSEIAEYYDRGFRQFHLSNSYPLKELEEGATSGGVSGRIVKVNNSLNILMLRNQFPDVEIIGGGGIRGKGDIEWYHSLGANHFSFSSIHFSPFSAFLLYREIKEMINGN